MLHDLFIGFGSVFLFKTNWEISGSITTTSASNLAKNS